MTEVPAGFEVVDEPALTIRYRDRRMALIVGGFTVMWIGTLIAIAVMAPLPVELFFPFGAAALALVGIGLWFAFHWRTVAVVNDHVVSGKRRPTTIAGDDIVAFEIIKTGGWVITALSIQYRSVDHHVIAKRRGGEETEVFKVAKRGDAEWVVARIERELRRAA